MTLTFAEKDFYAALKDLFVELAIPINYITEEKALPETIFENTWKDKEAFSLLEYVYILGGVDDEAFSHRKNITREDIKDRYDGILIFGITLKERENGRLPTRAQLADISRALHREFKYIPTIIVFKYGTHIALSSTERMPYEQKWREGEKAGKVSLLRDIDIEKPHAGHIRILEELKISNKIQSYEKLYEHWQNVFDVNILNKKFYKELSNWYFWAIKEVAFPNCPVKSTHTLTKAEAEQKNEHNAKSVIRLLTRFLFVWFIKEKKLVPEELFSQKYISSILNADIKPIQSTDGLFSEANLESVYYKAILQNVFFACLNCPINSTDKNEKRERGFRKRNNYGQHRDANFLLRYKKYFNNPEEFLDLLNSCIPFLNGGLFECLDNKTDNIYIDGFSDNLPKDHTLIVPDFLFFGLEHEMDISDVVGISTKEYKTAHVKGLIPLLNSYKFTITENTPIEQDVALDPELLGKVFENLLASYNPETKTTARKQTGSYYTPREIVNYMVDESLIAYLKNKIIASGASIVAGASSSGQKQDAFATLGQKQDNAGATIDENNVAKTSIVAGASSSGQKQDAFATLAGASSSGQKQDDSTVAGASCSGQKQDAFVTLAGASSSGQKQDAFVTIDPFLNPNDEIHIHKGNLPHWEQNEVWYFITFRLEDSLPKEKIEQLKSDREAWIKKNREKKECTKEDWKEYNELFTNKIEEWLNQGHGSCLLKKEKNSKIIVEALKKFEGERYVLDEWVIMPNHVHVLVKPIGDYTISDFTHSWKSYTANEINKANNRTGQLWMHESYDHIVRHEKAFNAIRKYIRQNPVKAGITTVEGISTVAGASIVAGASSSGQKQDDSTVAGASIVAGASSSGQKQDAFATLGQKQDNAGATLGEKLHQLLSFDDTNPFENDTHIKEIIVKALDECTILDPACGSGAFPMGILQKMVHVLQKIDPENELWKELQMNKAIAATDEAYKNITDKDERKEKINEINDAFDEKINDPDYARKLFLIEDCIYGVDIQPIAVQISKLRFFISLVVEQKVTHEKENFGIRPLPNLETKFVAANTLIGLEKPDIQRNLFEDENIQKKEDALKEVRHKIFSARSPESKRNLRKKDEQLRKELAKMLENNGWSHESAQQIAQWDPFSQNDHAEFFDVDWMFNIHDGFDIVIGNPPYVQLQKMRGTPVQKAYKEQNYDVYASTGDIYCLFYEQGVNILKQNGFLIYITSNKWMRAGYGEKIRAFFLAKNPVSLIDLGPGIFESATVDTNILLLQNCANKNELKGVTLEKNDQTIEEFVKENQVELHGLTEKNWFIGSAAEIKLKQKIENTGTPLKDWDVKINYGIKTGLNEAFIIDTETRDRILQKDPKSEEIIKPILRGRDIKRYSYEWNDLWVILSRFGMYKKLPDKYPAIYEHLLQYEERLKKRGQCRYKRGKTNNEEFEGQHHWLELDNNPKEDYLKEFEKEKIAWGNLCLSSQFTIVSENTYLNAPSPFITTSNKTLLGILNSKIADKYIRSLGVTRNGGYFEYKPMFVSQLPVPQTRSNKIDNLVDQIITLKQADRAADTSELEREIDTLVYDLYELTPAEISLIEKEMK